ncbi:MAG: DUF4013 domain-containing protein [Anaerolineaceae bacterium]|nr:DUF4013 domain-containing protein [Anaerolineaceae bacterium]
MDFGKAFTYPFQDPDWVKKILIPALVLLIPILGQIIVLGWALEITRRVIRQDPQPLPELDFGKNLSDGFKGFVIGLVYAIPAIILSIPPIIVSALTESGNSNSDSLGPVVVIVMLCCYGLLFIYGLALNIVLPAALSHFVATENLGAAFRFSEVFGLVRAAPGAYLMVLLGIILAGIIGGLGSIICFIGVLATYAYAFAIEGHLYGQAYNEATANRGYARAY